MAEFLARRHGIVHHLHKIIEEAKKELILISPYIRADDETKDLLTDKTRATSIHVVYGKEELHPKERSWFAGRSIRTIFRKNLHAKCFLNEYQAMVTSMNLHRFSQENNDEIGILVSKEEDRDLYEAIYKQAERFIANSEADESEGERSAAKTTSRRKSRATTKTKAGFCIRCKTDLPVKPTEPYCKSCYASWKRYENKTYEEKHCHTCGKKQEATMLKPVCPDCHRKYKDVLEFAVS